MITVAEGKEVAHGTSQALDKGDMCLKEFVTNSEQLRAEIDASRRAEKIQITTDAKSKALGMHWVVSEDYFYYEGIPLLSKDKQVTRRVVLSQVSSMYDPLGLISPVVLKGRMVFQDLCRLKVGWDDPVPESIESKWHAWLTSLGDLDSMKFPRCLVPANFVDAAAELVIFCDASTHGYGAAAYIRLVNYRAEIHVALIMSKGKLAPLKQVTIPRLELCAALEAVRLSVVLRSQMDIPFVNTTFFTDSEIVRAYICNDRARYKVFVANRVSEIRQHSTPAQWLHIAGKSNPSDVLSRGCYGGALNNSWLHGPEFLATFRCDWPKQVSEVQTELTDDPEVIADKPGSCNQVSDADTVDHPFHRLIGHYSCYYRLTKAVAWLLRFKVWLKTKTLQKGPLRAKELSEGEQLLFKHVQKETYADELDRLSAGRPVSVNSSIVKLDPMLLEGVLVVGGRLRYTQVSPQKKHPAILPKQQRLSKLIAKDCHDNGHLGVEWCLSRLRSRVWIVDGRNILKGIKRSCVTCRKLYAPVAEQKMSDLPPERCEAYMPPFTYTSFDIFGPYMVKHGRGEAKRYGIIFGCFTTRAVYLDVLPSLQTDHFLNALVRFIARKGCPVKLYCDNATTFVGGRNELARAMKQIDSDQVLRASRRLKVEWVFNVPYASSHAGVIERLIRTVRQVLKALLHPNARLCDDTLLTFFAEAENLINSRPITKVSDDVTDDSALTPNHFLILEANHSDALGKFDDADTYRRRWRHVQSLVNGFWKRWLRHYLPLLQSRQKWHRIRDNIKVNDLVLVVDPNVPRGCWPLALVTEVMPGRDGLTRSVKLRAKNKVMVRPLTKLVFLEGFQDDNE